MEEVEEEMYRIEFAPNVKLEPVVRVDPYVKLEPIDPVYFETRQSDQMAEVPPPIPNKRSSNPQYDNQINDILPGNGITFKVKVPREIIPRRPEKRLQVIESSCRTIQTYNPSHSLFSIPRNNEAYIVPSKRFCLDEDTGVPDSNIAAQSRSVVRDSIKGQEPSLTNCLKGPEQVGPSTASSAQNNYTDILLESTNITEDKLELSKSTTEEQKPITENVTDLPRSNNDGTNMTKLDEEVRSSESNRGKPVNPGKEQVPKIRRPQVEFLQKYRGLEDIEMKSSEYLLFLDLRSGVYRCDPCQEEFSAQNTLYAHICSTHVWNNRMGTTNTCLYCRVFFSERKVFSKHNLTFHKFLPIPPPSVVNHCQPQPIIDCLPLIPKNDLAQEMFSCPNYKIIFHTEGAVRKHTASCHNDYSTVKKRLVSCHLCDGLFGSEDRLLAHTRNDHKTDHAELFDCDQCEKFFDLHSLLSHKLSVHNLGIKVYECALCEEIFILQQDLVKHSSLVHNVSSEVYCKSTKPTVSITQTPVDNGPGNKILYSCLKCTENLRFATFRDYLTHVREFHPNIKCIHCGRHFMNYTAHSNHESRHRKQYQVATVS